MFYLMMLCSECCIDAMRFCSDVVDRLLEAVVELATNAL